MESPHNPTHFGSIPPGSLPKPRFLRARILGMIVDSALYVDGRRTEGKLALDEVPAACLRSGAFVWLGLY
jgi:hypothetical protein